MMGLNYSTQIKWIKICKWISHLCRSIIYYGHWRLVPAASSVIWDAAVMRRPVQFTPMDLVFSFWNWRHYPQRGIQEAHRTCFISSGFLRPPLWEFPATKRGSIVFQSTAPPSQQEMRTLSSTFPSATERWVHSQLGSFFWIPEYFLHVTNCFYQECQQRTDSWQAVFLQILRVWKVLDFNL